MAIACSFPDSPLLRLTAWAGGYGLFRLLLAALSPVPFAVPLDPLAICAAGVLTLPDARFRLFGRVLLLGGLLAGDLAAGLLLPVWLPRLAGAALLLLRTQPPRDALATALRLACLHAVWSAVAVEFTGDYPFFYIYGVTLLQSLLFIGLLTPLLPKDPFAPDALFWTALLVPAVIGLLWLLFPGTTLWPPPPLGTASGPVLRTLAVLLLLPSLLPLRMPSGPVRRSAGTRRTQSGKWQDLLH